MRKPSNTLLEAMDQMEQIPGISGVWSEVRCQTRHTKPMRKTDWAFITSSGWLYVNTEREASCPEKRGEIRKQAKSLKSSRLWTAGKQVTTE